MAETEPASRSRAASWRTCDRRTAVPWDREQTFDTIRRHTLEEVYEVFDAIERRAWPDLQDELGDLLLQVLFYAQMADRRGTSPWLTLRARSTAKLIRRHPHIFADTTVRDSAEVKRNWDEIKRAEKRSTACPRRSQKRSLLGGGVARHAGHE